MISWWSFFHWWGFRQWRITNQSYRPCRQLSLIACYSAKPYRWLESAANLFHIEQPPTFSKEYPVLLKDLQSRAGPPQVLHACFLARPLIAQSCRPFLKASLWLLHLGQLWAAPPPFFFLLPLSWQPPKLLAWPSNLLLVSTPLLLLALPLQLLPSSPGTLRVFSFHC